MNFQPILWSFAGYFVIVAVIAIVASLRVHTVNDFTLGRRQLGTTVTALSAGASDMSGWLLLGLPGAVYLAGMGEAWIVVGLVCGALINWTVVAPRLRRATVAFRKPTNTLSAFFRVRLADDSRALELVTALVILVFFTVYVAAGFIAGAKLAVAVLGVEYYSALLIGVGVIGIYTVVGGFLASSWTDAFQATLMALALVLVPFLAWLSIGDQVDLDWKLPTEGLTTIALVSSLAWGLGYCGQPHILARFMAIKQPRALASSAAIGMSWMVVVSVGAIAVGMTGSVVNPGLDDSETVFIRLAETVLSPWIAGVVIAAVLAAIMSTVDSQLVVASSSIIDLFCGTGTKGLAASRLIVVLVTGLALLIAVVSESTVLDVVSYAWAGLGGCLGPAVLLCLYWRRSTSLGLLLGMLCGGVTIFVWHMLEGGIFDLYKIVPAFVITTLVAMVVSLFKPSREAMNQYDHLRIVAAL